MPASHPAFLLCADDYALAPGVCEAILSLLAQNRLSATSVMATRPFWRGHAKALMDFRAHAQIGLHLNFTCAAPMTRLKGLCRDGAFPSIQTLLCLPRQKPHARLYQELRGEIVAQLDAFEAHAGQSPDFVDGHEHCHVLPAITPILLEVLAERSLAGKLWLRDPADTMSAIIHRRLCAPKALIVAFLASQFRAKAKAKGFATNFSFAGFSRFRQKPPYGAQFTTYLKSASQRHLIMCHPGFVDGELRAVDPITDARHREYAFLSGPDFPALLAKADKKLERDWIE